MKFKTEVCKFWQLNGACEYSDSCSFAHGEHELKQRTDIPRNYKTKQCKRFHKELYCPYGPRCQFLHDKPPAKASTEKKKAQEKVAAKDKSAEDAAQVSYSNLLQQVMNVQHDTDAQIKKTPEEVAEIPAIVSSNRRLQVFEDIPESLSDSLLSIE